MRDLNSEPARTCCDRVLIAHNYEARNKLRSQHMSFRLDVGTTVETQAGILYDMILVDNFGIKRRICVLFRIVLYSLFSAPIYL